MFRSRFRLNRFSRLMILAALSISLRIIFGAFPNIKPLSAIFLVSLYYFNLSESLLLMAITIIGSGILFGFHFVIFWQLVSFGIVQILWWYMIRPFVLAGKISVGIQSFFASIFVFIYGLTISVLTSLQFGVNPIIYWINGLVFDFLHSISTFLFYPIIYSIFRRFIHEKN